jgi:hypothetical protein
MPTPVSDLYAELPLSAQTAYAQLLDAALAADLARSVADLTGSFAAKTVKGRTYWYFQFTEPAGKLRQVYVGPDNDAVRRLMQRQREPSATQSLGPLARSALALGCTPVLPRHARVIRRLSEYGFFRAGGLLIGTHAFLAHGNMLGLRWGGQQRTQDIDFAHPGKALSLLLPSDARVDAGDAIASLQMGFLPLAGLNGKAGGTWLIPAEPEFRLDFLTPLHRGGDEPYLHPQLNVSLQPLPYMEFVLQSFDHAVMPAADGAVLVNVPSPERYALHKLLVFGERRAGFRAKANKDLAQAACLAAYLWDHRREALAEALQDLLARGKGWVARYRQGAGALLRAYPQLEAAARLATAV